jgi:hypothetical protein
MRILMDQSSRNQGGNKHLYNQLQEGMQALDRNGQPVGTIDRVHLGTTGKEENLNQNFPSNEAGRVPGGNTGLGEILQDVFEGAGEMDEEIRQDLLRSGFIRVRKEGVNSSSRFIQLNRIAGIQDDAVHLGES